MRTLNKSQKVLRWPFRKVTPDEFPRGWSGGREGAGCGRGPGGLSVPTPSPPGLACSGSLFTFNGGHWSRVWAGKAWD